MNGLACISLLLLSLLLSSCLKEYKHFHLLDGSTLQQGSIKEIEQTRAVWYEQYVGFVITIKDFLVTECVLKVQRQGKVNADIIDEKSIHDLKNDQVEKVSLQIDLSKHSRRFSIKEYLLKKYPYASFIPLPNRAFELKKGNTLLCRGQYHDFAIPNYTIELKAVSFSVAPR